MDQITFQMVSMHICHIESKLRMFIINLTEYTNVVAICILYYLIPDVRSSKDHNKILQIVEVSTIIYILLHMQGLKFISNYRIQPISTLLRKR